MKAGVINHLMETMMQAAVSHTQVVVDGSNQDVSEQNMKPDPDI